MLCLVALWGMGILMPQNSFNSLKKNPFKQLPPENFYEELNDSTISDIYDRVNGYSQDNEKTLLFIDDMTADLKRSKQTMDIMKRLIYNRRHLKINIIITAQTYNNIPLDVRKNITNLLLFKPSKPEFESVFSELLEKKKDICLNIMKTVANNLWLLFNNRSHYEISKQVAGRSAPLANS